MCMYENMHVHSCVWARAQLKKLTVINVYKYENMPQTLHIKFTLKSNVKVLWQGSWMEIQSSLSFLITSIHFNFLIWMYPFFIVLAIIYCDSDKKATISCVKNGHFCKYHLKWLKQTSDTILARSWRKWATPDPTQVTKMHHTATDMQPARSAQFT